MRSYADIREINLFLSSMEHTDVKTYPQIKLVTARCKAIWIWKKTGNMFEEEFFAQLLWDDQLKRTFPSYSWRRVCMLITMYVYSAELEYCDDRPTQYMYDHG